MVQRINLNFSLLVPIGIFACLKFIFYSNEVAYNYAKLAVNIIIMKEINNNNNKQNLFIV